MNLAIRSWTCLGISAILAVAGAVLAQEARKPVAPKTAPPVKIPKRPLPGSESSHRVMAPGVIKIIDQEWKEAESSSRHDMVELLAFDKNFNWAKDVPYRHEIWCLEFFFKPVRMIKVDIPQPGGVMRRELIWYLVYAVRNPGQMMVPKHDLDLPYQTFEGKQVWQVYREDRPIRFVPEFLLEGRDAVTEDRGFNKVYPDRVIPIALGPIKLKEDSKRRFYNSVEMCRMIKPGETVWGIATWRALDPSIDRFSIYIKGLTNAYKWSDAAGAYKLGDQLGAGRKLTSKTLRLNFWRPGDQFYQHEREIRFGCPGAVDHEWVYR